MKRFLITEEEKKQILNLYSKKGLMVEQDLTTTAAANTSQEPYENYKFAGWSVVVQGQKIIFVDRDYNPIVSYNGNLSNLKFDVTKGVFLNDDMLVLGKELIYNADARIGEGETPTKEKLLKSILTYVRAQQSDIKPNETKAIAFAVGISDNQTPEFIGIYPGISGQKEGVVIQGKSPKNIVTIPEIGFRDMYVVSNRKQFNEIKWFIDLINPEIEFKDFEKTSAVTLNSGNPYRPAYGTEKITPTTTETEEFVPLQIGDAISDPFAYDSADLSAEGIKLLKNFAKQFTDKKINSPKLYQDYLNSLKGQTITVNAYASIDEKSDAIMTGGYTACNKANQTRKAYNQCLSEARAQNVVNELKILLPDFFSPNSGITFTPVGVGETEEFAKGKKWPNATKDETLPNRRYTVVLPTFSKTYKTK